MTEAELQTLKGEVKDCKPEGDDLMSAFAQCDVTAKHFIEAADARIHVLMLE